MSKVSTALDTTILIENTTNHSNLMKTISTNQAVIPAHVDMLQFEHSFWRLKKLTASNKKHALRGLQDSLSRISLCLKTI